MREPAALTIAHAMPGRIRLKLAALRENDSLAAQLQARFATVAGVQRVTVNPRTGSLVLQYDPVSVTSPDSLRALLAPLAALFPTADLSDLNVWQEPPTEGNAAFPTLAVGIRSFFQDANETLVRATGGRADLKAAAPLLLFALGIRSLIKSEQLASPTWYDYLWFALGTYFMLNPKPGENQQ